jgi:hypothetical protein
VSVSVQPGLAGPARRKPANPFPTRHPRAALARPLGKDRAVALRDADSPGAGRDDPPHNARSSGMQYLAAALSARRTAAPIPDDPSEAIHEPMAHESPRRRAPRPAPTCAQSRSDHRGAGRGVDTAPACRARGAMLLACDVRPVARPPCGGGGAHGLARRCRSQA